MNVVAPSGVLTFLFTDIEGSTRRWDTDSDGMRSALAAHDDLMRATVADHDGWLFKHTGDGVCAAFSSPRSAVDSAVAAQRALELPVRMGIATGEAELRGDDYFGTVLNRAARVMAAGHGGQILLDDTTAALLTGIDFRDLGQGDYAISSSRSASSKSARKTCTPNSRRYGHWTPSQEICALQRPASSGARPKSPI